MNEKERKQCPPCRGSGHLHDPLMICVYCKGMGYIETADERPPSREQFEAMRCLIQELCAKVERLHGTPDGRCPVDCATCDMIRRSSSMLLKTHATVPAAATSEPTPVLDLQEFYNPREPPTDGPPPAFTIWLADYEAEPRDVTGPMVYCEADLLAAWEARGAATSETPYIEDEPGLHALATLARRQRDLPPDVAGALDERFWELYEPIQASEPPADEAAIDAAARKLASEIGQRWFEQGHSPMLHDGWNLGDLHDFVETVKDLVRAGYRTVPDEAAINIAWQAVTTDGCYYSLHSNPTTRDREIFDHGYRAGRREREEG